MLCSQIEQILSTQLEDTDFQSSCIFETRCRLQLMKSKSYTELKQQSQDGLTCLESDRNSTRPASVWVYHTNGSVVDG